jgi:hypothetical protein
MRSFRARVERGRIIVHEPIDLPDGVVYLVPLEARPAEIPDEPAKDSNGGVRPTMSGKTEANHRSSS